MPLVLDTWFQEPEQLVPVLYQRFPRPHILLYFFSSTFLVLLSLFTFDASCIPCYHFIPPPSKQ
ncbi:hypothetical protein BDV34DRAFT_54777 [Aspergillus parasiticus]|uniref:Uncharacterized protein n=1 Tax=Aspergillus parasiticus TaxID=5067 RepID=A0A5N6DT09_ASPPA|nr:hypothetical protein BDV34DRAFT_54777 [Aspergillus parasiticus]